MNEKEIKSIWIKFGDNDFNSQAYGAMRALDMVIDMTTAPEEFILKEFKFLMHHLANIKYRLGKSGHHEVSKDYFDQHCTIESLTYVPKRWYNSETIVYDFEKAEIVSL